jgi:hypothetical protein
MARHDDNNSVKQAKQVIMKRIVEEDNVTFDELEYLLNKSKLYEDEGDEKEVQTYDIWANDANLILWRTTNKLLIKAWQELADAGKFEVHSTSFYTYGAYSSPTGQ